MLRAAYDDMYGLNVGRTPGDLESHQPQREAVVQEIFLWVLCAKRRFHLNELLQALQSAEDIVTGSEVDGKLVLSLGSNFIRADQYQQVDFVQLSAREYLSQSQSEGRFSVTQKEMHARAASSCLRLMVRRAEPFVKLEIFEAFQKGEANFSSYASTYWPLHFKFSGILNLHTTEERRSSKFPDLRGSLDLYLKSLLKKLPIFSLATRHRIWSRLINSKRLQSDHVTLLKLILRRLSWVSLHQDGPIYVALIQCSIALDDLIPNTTETTAMATAFISENLEEPLELLLYARLVDSTSASLLFAAASFGSSRVTRMLLQYTSSDAASAVRDPDGKNLLEIALAEENFACADVLWRVFLEDDDPIVDDRLANEYAYSLGRGRLEMKHSPKSNLIQRCCIPFDSSLCDICMQLFDSWGGYKIRYVPSIRAKAKKGCPLCSHFVSLWNYKITNIPLKSDIDEKGLGTKTFSTTSINLQEIPEPWRFSIILSTLLVPSVIIFLNQMDEIGSFTNSYQATYLIGPLLLLTSIVWTGQGGFAFIGRHQPKDYSSPHYDPNIWKIVFLSILPPRMNSQVLQLCHSHGE